MSNFQFTRFNYLPTAVKNLLILNGLVFLATVAFPELIYKLGLYYPTSSYFQPYQIVTHMFTHGDFWHVFFNMFALWMFGAVLENVWGPKRFLIFYFVTGLGAAAVHMGVNAYQIYEISGSLNPIGLPDLVIDKISRYMGPTVGASGAVYGILIAFGMLFPNTLLYIYFLLPIKAKYVVIILIGMQLYLGFIDSPTDNVAHFAHLGGALFGFLLIKYWGRNKRRFY
ncbi:MAG: rhomboid family intramembrane serine protease [Bacteroidetes bacterium]|nr:rhomboid family intramembrane serine protease [Bacteroidota bacterium]